LIPEIKLLSDNLETEKRGEAVKGVKDKLVSYIQANQWDSAINFFVEYSGAFSLQPSIINIISQEFSDLVDNLFSLTPDFQAVMKLNFLSSMKWFDSTY